MVDNETQVLLHRLPWQAVLANPQSLDVEPGRGNGVDQQGLSLGGRDLEVDASEVGDRCVQDILIPGMDRLRPRTRSAMSSA